MSVGCCALKKISGELSDEKDPVQKTICSQSVLALFPAKRRLVANCSQQGAPGGQEVLADISINDSEG